jgi:hypothetical protein
MVWAMDRSIKRKANVGSRWRDNMRTIVWDDRVDVTLAGGWFGISITKGRDENDKDLLHLHVKQSITEEYIGSISKSETGKPAKFIPREVDNIVKQCCVNCKWFKTGILVETEDKVNTCDHASNQSPVISATVVVQSGSWCGLWKEK